MRKAINKRTGRSVAVKILAPDPKYIDEDAFDDVRQRFRREGIRGAGLEHENLVKIYAFEDNVDGECFAARTVKNPFIVMEFVRGATVESLIKKLGGSSEDTVCITPQTLTIGSCVADALVYLHKHKITHRDVKPANIFVSSTTVGSVPSVVKLGDFGVTKWGDFLAAVASGTLTLAGQQGLGTLKYMSPEQAVRPKDVTVRSDMFSLGVTLFELLTGRILPSPHHIFEIMSTRVGRASISGKLYTLGIRCSPAEETLFELVLDMFLTGPSGRPTSQRTLGNLRYHLDRISA